MRPFAWMLVAASGPVAAAVAVAPAVSPGGSLIQVFLGLMVVLGLMVAAAWALKRFGVARSIGVSPVRVIGGASLGGRERVVVLEAGDQWIVVGVAPGRVNALGTMPRRETAGEPVQPAAGANFAVWLRQSLDRRHGK